VKDLSILLKDLADARSEVESAFAAKKACGEMFNVFDLCGVGHYETMHSSILAEFLSPVGTHGMKNAFLEKFAEYFGKEKIGKYSRRAEVRTESSEKIGGESVGRFDILINDESTGHICIIENKIYAGEQPEQLKRYGRWLDKKAKEGWKTHLVFLTLDGHGSATVEDGKDYVCVAYSLSHQQEEDQKDIVRWLKQCAELAAGKVPVCNALLQYSNHLENLATGERAMSEKIIDMLLGINGKKSFMKAAQDAYENYEQACENAANVLLKEEVIKALGDKYRAEKSCKWGHTEESSGIWYFTIGEDGKVEKLKGYKYVIFNWTHFNGCEIALYQIKDKDNPRPILIQKELEDQLINRGWEVDTSKWAKYPIWRPVICGAGENDSDVHKYGACWDGLFFDRMKSEPDYHKMVIDEIVKGIKDLHKIQKEISKN